MFVLILQVFLLSWGMGNHEQRWTEGPGAVLFTAERDPYHVSPDHVISVTVLLATEEATMALPAISLKMIIFVHWLLTTWGCLYHWLPEPYICSNYAVLAIGVWAIAQRDSIDAIFMYLVGTVITILLDIIHIAISYDPEAAIQRNDAVRDQFRFSVGMAILSLLLKPVSCLLVYQMYKQRGGECYINIGFPGLSGSRDRTSYQTIGEQEPHHQPPSS